MFLGAGPSELIFILIIALIIFGPKRLPEIAKFISKAINEFKQASQGLHDAVRRDLIEPLASTNEIAESDSKIYDSN